MSFNINNASMADSISFTSSVFNDYYPNGQSPVKNTSASLSSPIAGRTLKSTTISGMINGDEFFRSPKYALKSLQNSVSSSINTFITGGASVADEAFSDSNPVSNPESQGETKEGMTLTKTTAYNRILAESISGKNLGSSFVEDSLNNMKQIEFDTYSGSSGTSTTSGNNLGQSSTEAQSAGRMDVAYINQLTEEERAWYQQRLDLLKTKYASLIEDNSKINGFSFDIPNDWTTKGYTVYTGERTYFPDAEVPISQQVVSNEVISAAPTNAYISAALIELLLLLHEKNYYIYGGLDARRDAAKSVKQTSLPNVWLSDHVSGEQ